MPQTSVADGFAISADAEHEHASQAISFREAPVAEQH
jgi:hypothetical protein